MRPCYLLLERFAAIGPGRPSTGRRKSSSTPVAAALSLGAGVAIALVATAGVRATTHVSGSTAVVEGVVRGLIVATPLAVGLYACRRPAHNRFGRLLVAFSGIWFLAALSSSSSPLVYSLGRVAAWIAEVGFAYALLAFPGGRLETKIDRALIAFAAAVALALYLPTALLVHGYPTPAPWASCDAGCPHNAFMVLRHEPGSVAGFVVPLREWLVGLLFVMVAVRLAAKLRAANTLVRRTVAPVLAVASARMLLFASAVVTREVAPHSSATQTVMWALALLVPAAAVAFLVGLLRWHVFVSAAVRHVHGRLGGIPEPQRVRDVLADAFDDPALRIGYWLRRRRRWVDMAGHPVDAPGPESGRWLTEVPDQGHPRVAILHDVALRDEQAFIDLSASLATMAFASEQLRGRAAATLRALQASRARIAAAADTERRRIERELHEGAQQRLVALRIHLELAAESQDENPEAASLRALGTDVEMALEDIRSLAHELYPAVLSDRGLAEALRSEALRSSIPTAVDVEGLSDYPSEISNAVYLCCVATLQDVASNGGCPTQARILLRESGSVLHFSVSDDGQASIAGSGDIINMRDRVAAVGGELTVHSRPGPGTRVSGRVPLSDSGIGSH